MSRIRAKNERLIIQAASEVFAEKGFAATKIIDIAKHSNLPKPNIYYYFKTKENLYRSVLESIVDPLLESSQPIRQYDDPIKALSEYIRAKIRISREHPHASKVFASEIMHGAPHLPQDIIERLQRQTQEITGKIQHWIERDLMDPVDPQHLLFAIWASTQTYADFDWQISMVTGKAQLDERDYETAAELITRLVLSGCKVRSPEPVQ